MRNQTIKTNEVPKMTASQTMNLIKMAVLADEPIMITGKPGIGKSAIVTDLTTTEGWNIQIWHAVTMDPTDPKGMPCIITDPDSGIQSAVFLPFDMLEQLLNYPDDAPVPLIVFLDDLGQAAKMVQAALMQLLLAREINGKRISKQIRFIAATNRKEDKAGVQGILEPVKSRFACIIELQPTVDEWVDWARRKNLYPTIPSFIRFKPTALNDFSASADMTQSPCQRTWHKLSNLLYQFDDLGIEDMAFRTSIVQGAIGAAYTPVFTGFEAVSSNLPDFEELLKHPEDFEPQRDKLDVLYAIIGGLAHRCTTKNIMQITKIAEKLPKEFSAYLMNDCLSSCPDIEESEDFTDWCIDNSDIFM